MKQATCFIDGCLDAPTLVEDPETGDPTVCRRHYQQWWRARKRSGEGAVTQRAAEAPCRCGCGKSVKLTGKRRRLYEEEGKLPFSSIECRDRDKAIMVKVPCAGACGRTLEKTEAYVAKNKTGRFICKQCSAAGVGSKPRLGTLRKCLHCGEEYYRPPYIKDEDTRFCSTEHRKAYEAEHRVTLTCEGCGETFEVIEAVAHTRRFHDKPCSDLAKIKRRVPGQWHNRKPKKYDSNGYIMIWAPERTTTYNGWVYEHRFVVEESLGMRLRSDEQVDHIDENKENNELSNLRIVDPVSHQLITVRNAKRRREIERAELAEYRRRFGPISAAGDAV